MRADSSFHHAFSLQERDLLLHLGFIFLQHEKFNKAVSVYDVLYEFFPGEKEVAFPLAYSLIKTDRADLAIDILKALKGHHESDPLIWLLRGRALFKLSMQAEAAKAMRICIKLKNSVKQRMTF